MKRKLSGWNGLTAEGLASPLVRVTRFRQKWSHHPSVWRGERERKKKSPPIIAHPLPARSHSIASVSVPLHHHFSNPREEEDGREKEGFPPAMKDRMQELRHVSSCLIVAVSFFFARIDALWKPRKAERNSCDRGSTLVFSVSRGDGAPLSVCVKRHQILPLINDRASVIPV